MILKSFRIIRMGVFGLCFASCDFSREQDLAEEWPSRILNIKVPTAFGFCLLEESLSSGEVRRSGYLPDDEDRTESISKSLSANSKIGFAFSGAGPQERVWDFPGVVWMNDQNSTRFSYVDMHDKLISIGITHLPPDAAFAVIAAVEEAVPGVRVCAITLTDVEAFTPLASQSTGREDRSVVFTSILPGKYLVYLLASSEASSERSDFVVLGEGLIVAGPKEVFSWSEIKSAIVAKRPAFLDAYLKVSMGGARR